MSKLENSVLCVGALFNEGHGTRLSNMIFFG
jgi:hypothetical protein